MTEDTKELFFADEPDPPEYKKLTPLEACRIILPLVNERLEKTKLAARIPDNKRDARRYQDLKNAKMWIETLIRESTNAY